jgi:hypothetical protein
LSFLYFLFVIPTLFKHQITKYQKDCQLSIKNAIFVFLELFYKEMRYCKVILLFLFVVPLAGYGQMPPSNCTVNGRVIFKEDFDKYGGGCDTVRILKLNVVSADTTTFSAFICEGETYFKNGFNESISGTYTQDLYNRYGCDIIETYKNYNIMSTLVLRNYLYQI